jgi:hypothetical protein
MSAMSATAEKPAIDTSSLYGPNDYHLEPVLDADGTHRKDAKGGLMYVAQPGLGPEADAALLARGGTRVERAELDAERAKLALERELFEEERRQFEREKASLKGSARGSRAGD